jgi:isoleucyl-tRNA synthetase
VTIAKLLAPFCPFIADEIYDNLDGSELSVHLCDWPDADAVAPRDPELEADMATARAAVALGLSARSQAKIKLRQPLAEAVVVAAGRERQAIERLAEIVRDELNVKRLRFVAEADELGSYEVVPNYRTLGPRFGKNMPQAAAAIEALDAPGVATALREDRPVAVSVAGHDHLLSADDLELRMQPLDGYQLEREGGHAVALDLHVDESLRREGLAREVVRAIQLARQGAGLEVSDRIDLALGGDDQLLEAAREHEVFVSGETLAVSVRYDLDATTDPTTIEGRTLYSSIAQA